MRIAVFSILILFSNVTFASAEEEQGAIAPEASEQKLWRVELQDGQVLRGRITSMTKERLVMQLASGGEMALDTSLVKGVKEEAKIRVDSDGQLWFEDPNRTRYFYGPSAFMLRKGALTLSQKQLFLTSVGYGITDWLSVEGGMLLPFGYNFVGSLKLGIPIGKHFHIAGGAQTLWVPFFGIFGIGFLSTTYGTSNLHLTISAGLPFLSNSFGGSNVSLSNGIYTLSGNVRVAPNLALLTENWLLTWTTQWDSELILVNVVGVRLFSSHLSLDLGVVSLMNVGLPGPLPWIDLTYNF